jgi:hypothetical protein
MAAVMSIEMLYMNQMNSPEINLKVTLIVWIRPAKLVGKGR